MNDGGPNRTVGAAVVHVCPVPEKARAPSNDVGSAALESFLSTLAFVMLEEGAT